MPRALAAAGIALVVVVVDAHPAAAPQAHGSVRTSKPAHSTAPGALPRTPLRFNDSYRGWPVAPVHAQHPIRSSFLDPRSPGRSGDYHFGIDISVRDDLPERGAPSGRTHRVYAIEGGRAVPANEFAAGCFRRRVVVGHFEYWHTDSAGVLAKGQHVKPGQMIGWTCKGLWHVHLAERRTIGGVTTWVNPLRRGGKLAPYADTLPPVIRRIRFFTPAFAGWSLPADPFRAPPAGERLSKRHLHGLVDVRASIADPQSFRGFFARLPRLYADLHPYRVRLALSRAGAGGHLLVEDVFRSDVYFAANLPSQGLPVLFDFHYAPGTAQTLPAAVCLDVVRRESRSGCQGEYWFRLFARGTTPFWQTRRYDDGEYRLAVIAWDIAGNRARAATRVTIDNR